MRDRAPYRAPFPVRRVGTPDPAIYRGKSVPFQTIVIVLDLCCNKEHRFEGWFASAHAFEDQCARQLVSCPVCASVQVRRLPSAPYVQTRQGAQDKPVSERLQAAATPAVPATPAAAPVTPETVAAVLQLLRHMARDADDVGERLPEEARRIHYGEAEARNIRGQASADDVEELLEEGIMIVPLPPGEDEVH